MSLWSDFQTSANKVEGQMIDSCTKILIEECRRHKIQEEGWHLIGRPIAFFNETMSHFCHRWCSKHPQWCNKRKYCHACVQYLRTIAATFISVQTAVTLKRSLMALTARYRVYVMQTEICQYLSVQSRVSSYIEHCRSCAAAPLEEHCLRRLVSTFVFRKRFEAEKKKLFDVQKDIKKLGQMKRSFDKSKSVVNVLQMINEAICHFKSSYFQNVFDTTRRHSKDHLQFLHGSHQ